MPPIDFQEPPTVCPRCGGVLNTVVHSDLATDTALIEIRCIGGLNIVACGFADSGWQHSAEKVLAEPIGSNMAEPPGSNL